MAAHPRSGIRSRRRRPDGGLATLAAAALALSPFAADRADAETIILKDGTRIPCRILLEGEEEVVARIAGGMEVSYKAKDISRIDRGVSSVEIYEAVAERISEGNLGPALYLGWWCLENGLEKEAGSFFEAASRDRAAAGRAYLASAKLARSAVEKRSLFAKAAIADPALQEAVDALCESPVEEAVFPADLLAAGAELASALDLGDPTGVLKCLSALERCPDKRAGAAYAERFREFTGLSFAELRERCVKQRGGALGDTDAEGRCAACRDRGYVQCPMCAGRGYKFCRTCQGVGTTRVRKYSSRYGVRISVVACPGCKGSGGEDCRACARLPSGSRTVNRLFTTSRACDACGGKGSIETGTVRTTMSGRKVVTHTTCAACRGVGRINEPHTISLSVTSSGRRPCAKCNAGGTVALADVQGRSGQGSAGGGILRPEEQARLAALAEVIQPAGGDAGLRWRAGPKVPFRFATPGGAARQTAQVFAFGQWCTPSMRDLKARTAKSLGYKPRKIDTSDFDRWVRERELSYLRSNSQPLWAPRPDGAPGEPRAADVRALVAALECARRAGISGSLAQSTVLCTAFLPKPVRGGAPRASAAGDASPTVARLETSDRGAALVLLRDAASWPATEVTLDPVPPQESGLDLAPAMGAALSAGQPLTIYYRIRSLSREMVGRGPAATTRAILSAEVLAATIGPEEKPSKVWTRDIGGQ